MHWQACKSRQFSRLHPILLHVLNLEEIAYRSVVYNRIPTNQQHTLNAYASQRQELRISVQRSTPVHGHFMPSLRLNFHSGANSTSQSRRGAEPRACLFGQPPRKRLENMPTETGRTGGSGFLGSWCCKFLLDAALHCPV